ncbi:ATP-binding protein [Thermodesulfobacteriota bacterium]
MAASDQTGLQESKLQKQVEVLQRVDRFMSNLDDLEQLLEQIMEESQYVTESEASSLALYNEADEELVFEVVLGEKGAETKQHVIKIGQGIIGKVAQSGNARIIDDAYSEPDFNTAIDKATGFKTRNIMAVPMLRRGKLIGVIEVLNKKNNSLFTADDQAILEILSHQAAIAIENARLYRDNIEKAHLASLGEGISGAAHCIKNIVGIMTMGTSGIEFGIATGDMHLIQESWSPLQNGCKRISDLVLDMLSYAKDRVPEPAATDINKLLSDCVRMMTVVCAEKGIAIVEELDPLIGVLLIDERGINRCVINFITNAIDALAECDTPRIIVRSLLDADADVVEIQIEDNGSGIPASDLEKIFEVFFSTKGSKGTGLGLATTQKIIQEHGGNVQVSSTPGEATVFAVRLPAKKVAGN